MSHFSERYSGRRVMLVLPDHDYQKLLHHDPDNVLHSPQVNVIRYEDFESGNISHPVLDQLDQKGLVAPGQVLIQDPFSPNVYYEQSDALTKIALRKHFHLSVICQKLGAKSLKVTQVDVVAEDHKTSAGGGGSAKGVDASGSYEQKVAEKLRQEMSLVDNFKGSDPDVDGARDYLEKHNLDSDINMVSLVEISSNRTNRHLTRELVFNVSSEANKNLKICAAIGVDKIASIKGKYSTESSKTQDIRLKIEVDFGEG